MAQSLRQDFNDELAKMVLGDIQAKTSRYYYFLGGVEPWNGIGGSTVDDIPPNGGILQTDQQNRKYRSEIAFVKLISPNDVTLAIRKIPWESGKVFDEWDHTQEMATKDFYVVTSDFNIYKCLSNNNGAESTVEPTGNSIYPFDTSDGYKWKYMYNIPAFKRTRFSSVNYIPVQRALSNSFYNNGAIESVAVINEGNGYVDAQLTSISVDPPSNPGLGATATVVTDSMGAITQINITNGGTGFLDNAKPKVVIASSGAGSRAKAKVISVNGSGAITGVQILDGGIGYAPETTTVSFIVGGASLLPVISSETGEIIEVKIIDPGSGYPIAPNLTVMQPTGGPGTGKYGSNTSAILSCVVYEGSIRHVNIIDPGKDYLVDNATTITIQGDGSGAVLSPIINDGKIVDVVVENSGSGYDNVILTVQPQNLGAKLEAVISQSDFISDQMVIEQTAIKGAIYNIKITTQGTGYQEGKVSVAITGNGTGCTATATAIYGKITNINITNPGSGYTYANVEIIDTERAFVPEEQKAKAYCILPPLNGHGFDATQELYAQVLAINTPLRGEMEIEGIVQEYRNFGIIKDPRNLISGEKYTKNNEVLVYTMKFLSTTSLIKDQILYLDQDRYRVLEISGADVSLIPIDREEIIPIGTLTSEDNINYQSLQVIKSIEFNKYSGSMIYISTENPFSFASDQSITIKTFIKF